jgi:hypothetical protein
MSSDDVFRVFICFVCFGFLVYPVPCEPKLFCCLRADAANRLFGQLEIVGDAVSVPWEANGFPTEKSGHSRNPQPKITPCSN